MKADAACIVCRNFLAVAQVKEADPDRAARADWDHIAGTCTMATILATLALGAHGADALYETLCREHRERFDRYLAHTMGVG
jgi:hypothetical protein